MKLRDWILPSFLVWMFCWTVVTQDTIARKESAKYSPINLALMQEAPND